ncbi:unnamed protein product [Symbiodinium natans]|uniref:Uncharacterized protein n=1 Tax=Symbiodinium natans TaxID=878477 RepID=A0A812RSH7_9DINO|nr:unnamed protein product [Symbiodinium natans]
MAVEALTECAPLGGRFGTTVGTMQKQEKEEEILEAIRNFLKTYEDIVVCISGHWYSIEDDDYNMYHDYYTNISANDPDEEDRAECHGPKDRPRFSGHWKLHATRAARHHRQHGRSAALPPSITAAQKKAIRCRKAQASAESYQDFTSAKRWAGKVVEEGRKLKNNLTT